MTLDRLSNTASMIEMLDRLIDRGIVIASLSREAPVAGGAHLLTSRPRMVEQLHRVRAQLEQGGFETHEHRRFEDRVREARRDARARTLSGGS